MKSITIFYKSYKNDFKLLHYSLKSLSKNVTGYTDIVILIPESEKHLFDTTDLPARALVHYVNEFGSGYLYQQYCKITGHNYTDSDFILFADSDLMFDHPINLQDFIADGKPEILYTDWSKVGQAICWKEPTQDFMKEDVPYEFMRRNCLIYHRSTLANISFYDANLRARILNAKSFSEYNAIGAYAFKYERENYNFVNTDEWSYVPPKAIQLWSWFNTGSSQIHIEEKKRAIETINQVLGLNITDI